MGPPEGSGPAFFAFSVSLRAGPARCGHVTMYAMDQPSPRTAQKPTGVQVSVTTFDHAAVRHPVGEYVRGEVHPNGMEGRRLM